MFKVSVLHNCDLNIRQNNRDWYFCHNRAPLHSNVMALHRKIFRHLWTRNDVFLRTFLYYAIEGARYSVSNDIAVVQMIWQTNYLQTFFILKTLNTIDLFYTDLHTTLSDFLNKVARVGCSFYVKSVLICSRCGHGLHPLLRPGHHHVHVCNKPKGKQITRNMHKTNNATLPGLTYRWSI